MVQWFAATIAVLALVLALSHGLRMLMERRRNSGGAVVQAGAWRIAPDASVRAVRVLGRVHLIYERGRESLLLDSLDAARLEELVPTATDPRSILGLGRARRDEATASRVARG